jgi:hypothetical protein
MRTPLHGRETAPSHLRAPHVEQRRRLFADYDYRCYFFRPPGKVVGIEELTCPSDAAAVATAIRLFGHRLKGGEMEVRRDNRVVGFVVGMDCADADRRS